MKARYFLSTLLLLMIFPAIDALAQVEQMGEGVMVIRDVFLKGDVDPTAFEAFMLEESIPVQEKCQPGTKVLLIKGDRGREKGEYKLVVLYESVDHRNAYWPQEGTAGKGGIGAIVEDYCEDYKATSTKFTEFLDREKFQALGGPAHTNFVVVSKNN